MPESIPNDTNNPHINAFFDALTNKINAIPNEARIAQLEAEVAMLKGNMGAMAAGAGGAMPMVTDSKNSSVSGSITSVGSSTTCGSVLTNSTISNQNQTMSSTTVQQQTNPSTFPTHTNSHQAVITPPQTLTQPPLDFLNPHSKTPSPQCPTKLLIRCPDYNTIIKQCGAGCYLLYSEEDQGTLTQQWISNETAEKENWPGQTMPNVLFHCKSDEFLKLPKWKYNSNGGMATRASEITKSTSKVEDKKGWMEAIAGFFTEMVEKKVTQITMLSQLDSSQSPCNRIIKFSTQIVTWTLLKSDLESKGAPQSSACSGEFERCESEGDRVTIINNTNGSDSEMRQLVAIGVLPKAAGEVFKEGEKFDMQQFFRFCMKENGWCTKEMKKVVRR